MCRVVWTAMVLAVVGCVPGGETGEAEEEVTDDCLAFGDIEADDGSIGEVCIRTAFGMATNGQGGIYLSANEAATCARVVEYLQTHDSPFNPHDILVAGECNMSFTFDYVWEDGWDGETFDQEDALRGIWSINCAMEDGVFALETRKDHRDYYWTGPWWQGDPTIYSATVAGNQEDMSMAIDFEMSEYTGNYIYDELREVLAAGAVAANEPIEPAWCTDLVWTSLFDF